jgi:pyridoxal phosphate enzyme (YggS family)
VTEITDHLAHIVERVARASESAHRTADSVTIVAVSKQLSTDSIAAAYRCGVRNFGESYAQEALPKMTALANLAITWHFIGALQANKTRAVAEGFAWVHTLDRIKIAVRLNDQRPPGAPPLNVLIQVNQANEPQKGGVAPKDVVVLAREIKTLPRLKLRGLMTLPPHENEGLADWFGQLAALKAQLSADGFGVDSLSMGMSADFEAAIAAGATMVRIGTAIFGPRGAHC